MCMCYNVGWQHSFKIKCTDIIKLGSSIDWQYSFCHAILTGNTGSRLTALVLLSFVVVLAGNTVPVIQCWLTIQVQILTALVLLSFVVVLAGNTVPVIQCWLAPQFQS